MIESPSLRLVKQVSALILLVILVDQATGYLFRQFYFSQKSGDYFRTTYVLDSVRKPCLILGGSRAAHHYIPALFDSALGTPTYNTGRDDNEIFYSLAVFRAVTERYYPEILILELSPKEFYYGRKSYDKLASLLPYYRYHPELHDIIRLRSPIEHIKLLSAIYPYNSKLFLLLNGKWNLNQDPGISTAGYLPFHTVMRPGKLDNDQPEPALDIDSNKVRAVREILEVCIKSKIRVLMLCSPIYSNPDCKRANAVIEDLARQYQVPYWDFSRDTSFDYHPELFKDNSHLNDHGARIYTRLVTGKINQHFSNH